MIEAVEEVWEQFTTDVEEVIDAGENVVAGIRISGHGRGSGVEVDMRLFNVWTFKDRKVWRMTGGYRDRSEALRDAGLDG